MRLFATEVMPRLSDLNVDQRIVVDLIAACERVAAKVDALGAAD